MVLKSGEVHSVERAAEKALVELERQGLKARTVSVIHLPELRENIERFQRQGMLEPGIVDVYMKWSYDAAAALPGAKTVFIASVPQPVTRARFDFRGKSYTADVPPTYIGKVDDARVKAVLEAALTPGGFKVKWAILPVKTLAVRSGLARYGRNNVTYVAGSGSYQRLVAFYSDCPCARDSWGELAAMKTCEKCVKCREACPPRCIPEDRFLLHAEKCLTWHNEMERPLPDWVKPEWHNALVGCMVCQRVCPANRYQNDKIAPGPAFSEEETGSILQKPPLEKLPEATRQKIESIAMDDSYDVLARNLAVLIKSQDMAGVALNPKP